MKRFLARYFQVYENGSSVGVEVRAGITTFLTMSYILFVNPQILSKAIPIPGIFPQLLFATAAAAAIGSLLMGLFARYPFAQAPGMGLNAYFTYTVCMTMKVPWQVALGAVFVEGIIFMGLSFGGVRQAIMNGIPTNIKYATTAGIGMFLAMIGLHNAGIVAPHPATWVTLGDLKSPTALVTIFGLLITAVLLVRKVPGAVLYGILGSTLAAILTHAPVYVNPADSEAALIAFPGFGGPIVRAPVWPHDLFMAMDVKGALSKGAILIVFTFLFVEILDTAGTLIGLATKAGFLDKEGNLPRANQAFLSDAIATSCGAVLGTSTTTAFIESAAGIEEGGRTGLTAVVTGLLFALSVFLWPLAGAVPAAATAPALILVGSMMTVHLSLIHWNDYSEIIPAFLTMIVMPFTYSIANGVSFGLISYVMIKVLSGRGKELHPVTIVLGVLLVLRYAVLGRD